MRDVVAIVVVAALFWGLWLWLPHQSVDIQGPGPTTTTTELGR
jgi:hypothetical protein